MSIKPRLGAAVVACALLIWGSPAAAQSVGPAAPGTAKGIYDPVTGEITVSSNAVLLLGIRSSGGALIGSFAANPNDLLTADGAIRDNSLLPNGIGWLDFGGINVTDAPLGSLVAPGTPLSDLSLTYQLAGSAPVTGTLTVVPEPGTALVVVTGSLAALARRRR
jgi:hypothetical protein